jgi:hypothetical protein
MPLPRLMSQAAPHFNVNLLENTMGHRVQGAF